MKDYLEQQINEASLRYKIPLRFLLALIATESSFNPFAFRHERGYIWTYSVKECAEAVGIDRHFMQFIQQSSFGLCQIMAANVYQMGFKGWIGNLFLPDINLKYGCDYINSMIKNHKLSFSDPLDVYACYNAGSIRKVGDQYVNATNVHNFKKHYEQFQG